VLKGTTIMCKHALAVRVAAALETINEVEITDKDFQCTLCHRDINLAGQGSV